MRTKACLGWQCGVGVGGESERHEGINRTKGQQRSLCREWTPVEWSNIFAFWLLLFKCKSKDKGRVRERIEWREPFKCSGDSSWKRLFRYWASGASCDVADHMREFRWILKRKIHMKCFLFTTNTFSDSEDLNLKYM